MHDPNLLWQAVVTTALIGTARRAELPARSGDALGRMLAALPAETPEGKLLGAAATLALYRRAGQLPEPSPASPLPAEPETLPRCTPAAATHLTTMLGGQHADLLPEWLTLAAGHRVPEELLPEVLQWGQKNPEHLPLIMPVLDVRGRWLAKWHPAGRGVVLAALVENATPERLTHAWETEERPARVLLLQSLRAQNPAFARTLLISTWAEDGAEERLAFLQTFKSGLSMDDEPFLETALDDRAKDVRRTAADLLAHLPASRLVQRQTARAQRFLHWKPGGFLRKAHIEITLPETCDKEMQRDGVELKPPRGRTVGEKAWWLAQILEAVPPSNWSQAWSQSPAEILEASGGEWQELLSKSWETATARFQDSTWAEALLQTSDAFTMLAVLPSANREALLTARLQTDPQKGLQMLLADEQPWSEKLSRLALPHLRKYFLEKANARPSLHILRRIGRCLPPHLGTEAARFLIHRIDAEMNPTWDDAVQTLLQTLEFRRALRTALTNNEYPIPNS